MDQKQKIAAVAVVGLGLLGVLWLANRGRVTVGQPNSPTLNLSGPSSPPTYQVGVYQGTPPAASPALQAMYPPGALTFNILDGGSPIWGNPFADFVPDTGGKGNGLSNAVGYGDGCGCGCNQPGGTTDATGTLAGLAALTAPFMNKLVSMLPSGIVAPEIVDPGATSDLQAAIDVMHRQQAAMLDPGNVLFSPAYNDTLGSI